MKKHPPLLFIDCETLGLGDAPIWEVCAMRVDEYGDVEAEPLEVFVTHQPGNWLDTLPKPFVDDYRRRYDATQAVSPSQLVEMVSNLAAGKAIVCGSNPSFDMQRIEKMARFICEPVPPWHYHPEDVPTLARGWLHGRGVFPAPPWKSDLISQMVGVDPTEFDRHSAYGDVMWCYAMWQAVTTR